jgi:hypothetical protein
MKTKKMNVKESLNEIFQNYVVETTEGTFQVFKSFTYGEMALSFLLFTLIVLFVLKWIWEVVR